MTKTLTAIFDGETFRPDEPVDLQPNTHVTITIDIPNLRTGSPEDIDPLEALFGSVSLGHSLGTDNDAIDEDLAREYAATHED